MKATNAVLIVLAAVLFVNISMTVRQGSQIDLVKARTEGIRDLQATYEELYDLAEFVATFNKYDETGMATSKKLIHREPPKTDFEAQRIYQEQYLGQLTGESIYQIYQMRRAQDWSVTDAWHYAHLALPGNSPETQQARDEESARMRADYGNAGRAEEDGDENHD